MKSKAKIEEMQAIAALYFCRNEDELDEETRFALTIISDLLCYITDHDCDSMRETEERFNEMKKELEEEGIDIQEAMLYVKGREKHEQAKLN